MNNTCEKVMLNEENSYHTIDFSIDGRRFVVAGVQTQIEFYETETNKPFLTLTKDQNKCHFNKIFSVKHGAINPNQIYSGSWDMNVKVWDIRAGQATHNINGV